ncbi:low affinity iron permease family protein [Lacihabitans lacunae]|uniref:Low affinity iron permease family protein n=1 Tax=Lacihabitans lacunae TaxID=1028214 RepID=A0ABV7Z0X8_9BACT
MKNTYQNLEAFFEKIAFAITSILGSSITFFLAFMMIIFWFLNRDFETLDTNEVLRDMIHGITFLSLFVIQKEFSRFSGSLHLKVNELVVSTKTANKAVINVESKSEKEIHDLQKEYTELADQIQKPKETKIDKKA